MIKIRVYREGEELTIVPVADLKVEETLDRETVVNWLHRLASAPRPPASAE